MLLKQGLDFLGGVETLIPKDAKILLKPNLLKKAEVEKAVITHPVVVGAFAGILRESGYENIVLADSCGHGTTQAVIRGTGMDTYLEKYHIPAVDYSEGVKTAYPQGAQAKEFILPKELLEQDCVISLSKMKTHALERITGAVKNSYGFIYGFHKAKGHTQYPSADSFARMLIDLNKCVAPKLYVMDGIVAMEGNGPGSGIFLQITFQRTCTIYRVIAILDNLILGCICQFQGKLLVCKTFVKLADHQVYYLTNIGFCQGLKHNYFIQTVQEFRTEMASQVIHNLTLSLRFDLTILINTIQQIRRTDVGSHDKNCILKVNCTSLRICDTAIIQYLQQYVKHIRMCFLNLIEKYNTVWFTADCLSKLATLLISYIPEALRSVWIQNTSPCTHSYQF